MQIDELTIKQAKELTALLGGQSSNNKPHPYVIGEKYLIRTVTMTHIGKLKAVYENELLLENDSWIASTGRFHDTIKGGEDMLDEVEPFVDDVIIGRGSIVDMTLWRHSVELKQK